MKTLRIIVFIMAGFLATEQLYAHALWIETAPVGKPGTAQQVKIYYGEPSAGTVDKVKDWWSDVGTFILWLHLPDGSRQQVETSAHEDHFQASFTPTSNGIYTLSIAHPVKDTYGEHKYQFNSTALVNVGKSGIPNAITIDGEFRTFAKTVDALSLAQPVEVNTQFEGKPLKELEVNVFSPNGWSKTFHTDDHGVIAFTPDRKGCYLVEALHTVDVEEESYKHLHRISTWGVCIN